VTQAQLLRKAVRFARHAGLVAFAGAALALADGIAPPLRVAAYSNDVEGSVVRAITELRQHGLKRALSEVDEMLARNPNYRLGYLIKGDLLMASAGQPMAFASKGAPPADALPLQDEARVRVMRYVDAPPTFELPATLLQLSPRHQHALVIDTSTNRLFVFANDLGRPRYVTDFYISLGKNGVEKQREGDMKTPFGVYTLMPMKDKLKDKLPEIYGPGAYPLSYPNEWDKVNGRGGHGIWLHGTPSETYARPPWATDGCVVLTNEDLAKLSKYVDVTRTPVVIGPSVLWRAPSQWEAEREAFLSDFNGWKKDWESLDANRYLSHYSRDFRSARRDYAGWSEKKRQVSAGKTWIKVGIDDMSLFEYPGEHDLVMVSFEQDYRSNNLSKRTFKRQFWAREGGHWRIVHEAVVGS